MTTPELASAITLIKNAAADVAGVHLERDQVELFLRSVLFEPRNLWPASEMGLITHVEAAGAVAAHLQTWLADLADVGLSQGSEEWEKLAADLKETLFGQAVENR